ncbi:hypothetical protein RND81_07G202500 [Saponaria officinalis]|uniref:Pentatricopeptide repeat-containing protein n=2 Tax=Saponaria officinalis TaxID=3572 RepID=A0AAW1JV95_SAPOF
MATSGNLLLFRFHLDSHFRFHSQFFVRNYSIYSCTRRCDDPKLFVESVREQCKLGFPNAEIPVSIFDQLRCLRPRPCIILFTRLFTAMCKIRPHPPFSTVVTFSNQLEVSGLRPDCHSVGILANCYCRLGRVDFAFSLFGKRLKLGYPPDVFIVTTLLNGLITSDKLQPAVQLLDKVVKLGQWDDAKGLLSEMLDNNIAPDSTLIDMYCKEGHVDEARAIYELTIERGVHPNVITYNALLNGYCLRGDMAEAENLVDVMVKDGIVPDVVTFNSLINGYCKSKQVDKALVMFEDTRVSVTHITPDVVTYNTLIDALCKENRFHLALQQFEEMKDQGVAPDVVTYNSLLDGLLKNAEIDMAVSLRREMDNNGVAPDICTYNIMINGLCEAGRMAEVVEVFSYIVAKGLRPDVTTYNIMIKVLCRQGLLGDATELLKKMEDTRCSPNEYTYNTLIKGFLNANDVAKALDFLHIMRAQGFLDADDYTTPFFLGLLTNPNVSDADKALLQKYFPGRQGEDMRKNEANCV